MAQSRNDNVQDLANVLAVAAKGLNRNARKVLVAHPGAVRSALAAAASALQSKEAESSHLEVIGSKPGQLLDEAEAERRLAERTQPGEPENVVTSDEFAKMTGLKSRQTVHEWLKKGRIVGWQGATRRFVFPVEQLDDRKRPLQGLDRVQHWFADGYVAWVWLTTPLAALDGARPLDRLRDGDIDMVEAAAKGYAHGDFA